MPPTRRAPLLVPARVSMGPTTHALAVAVLTGALVAGAAACGGPHRVAAKTWAGSVCAALTPWRARISSLTTEAQQQLQTTTTAPDAKTHVVDLLAGAQQASETARKGVAAAGTPEVTNGAAIAAHFTDSLSAARDAYGHARTSASRLSTGDSTTFYAGIRTVFGTLTKEYDASALDLSSVGSPDLQKAFDEVPECR